LDQVKPCLHAVTNRQETKDSGQLEEILPDNTERVNGSETPAFWIHCLTTSSSASRSGLLIQTASGSSGALVAAFTRHDLM
jgi:hypothetical protein